MKKKMNQWNWIEARVWAYLNLTESVTVIELRTKTTPIEVAKISLIHDHNLYQVNLEASSIFYTIEIFIIIFFFLQRKLIESKEKKKDTGFFWDEIYIKMLRIINILLNVKFYKILIFYLCQRQNLWVFMNIIFWSKYNIIMILF